MKKLLFLFLLVPVVCFAVTVDSGKQEMCNMAYATCPECGNIRVYNTVCYNCGDTKHIVKTETIAVSPKTVAQMKREAEIELLQK